MATSGPSSERLAAADPPDLELIERAVAVVGTIRYKWKRSEALAYIAERLASADPPDRALSERALAVAEIIPDDLERSEALAVIVERLDDPPDRP